MQCPGPLESPARWCSTENSTVATPDIPVDSLVLINGFARTTEPAAIEHALELLVKAEKRTEAADIEAATNQVERVLRPPR